MSAPSLMERRKVAAARRRRPSGTQIREFPASGEGSHGPETAPRPTDLHLETTYEDGRVVSWFNDNWWLETLRRWKDRALTIHIQRTPDALLHSMMAYELEMVRRLEVPWRLVGHCYLSDIGHPLLLPRVAVSQYDEIRIINADRPSTADFEVRPPKLTLQEVFDRVREIQAAEQVSQPLLTRAPDPDATPRTTPPDERDH